MDQRMGHGALNDPANVSFGDDEDEALAQALAGGELEEQANSEADFMALPLKLSSTGQNYLMSADQSNYAHPQIISWPPSPSRPTYTLTKQITQAAAFDLIASFMSVPILRNQQYRLQELRPTDFEYKLVETAFVSTGGPSMDPQRGVGMPGYGGPP